MPCSNLLDVPNLNPPLLSTLFEVSRDDFAIGSSSQTWAVFWGTASHGFSM